MRRVAIALVVGWLLGVASGLVGVAVTGGWYEYRLPGPIPPATMRDLVEREGWEPFQVGNITYFRRPRIRLGT